VVRAAFSSIYLNLRVTSGTGVVMTNSGKMAHYAPSNIGVRLAFGSLAECVRSAVEGKVMFDG
jgi:predicted aconitase